MSRPLDVEKIAELEQRNSQLEGMNAMRGRMTLGMLNEGLQALLLAARAGDPGAQTDLAYLRRFLKDVLDSGDDARSRIAVVRSGN